jgi:hypothetical protein
MIRGQGSGYLQANSGLEIVSENYYLSKAAYLSSINGNKADEKIYLVIFSSIIS